MHIVQYLVHIDKGSEIDDAIFFFKHLESGCLHPHVSQLKYEHGKTEKDRDYAEEASKSKSIFVSLKANLYQVSQRDREQWDETNEIYDIKGLFLWRLIDVSPELVEAFWEDDLVWDTVLEQ